ncbi:MAG: helix-turn-helix transcriptional regulator [Bacteroidota bacterium]
MKKKTASKKADPIIPQAKLLRLFQIISVLKSGHWTIKDLADRFNTSQRTIYRYINLLEEVDFMIEKDFANRYFIITSEDEPGQSQFSVEETKLIKKLIQSGTENNPLRNVLLKKLSFNSELDSMPRLIVRSRVGKFVDQLADAIKRKVQVTLKNYHSAHSNEIRDRLVEPIHFGDNYQSIMALDTNDKVCKQFKLDRIGEIVDLQVPFQFETLHKKNQTDIFGFTGDADTWVTIRLSLRAYLLLREEFPLAVPYIEKKDGFYEFTAPVASFDGVGRFLLGLLDETTVMAPESFIKFIRQKLEKQIALKAP